MPVYNYRSYPPMDSGADSREFAIEQLEDENTLVVDPQTGYPVKRVLVAGQTFSIPLQTSGGAYTQAHVSKRQRQGCCGRGCGCH
jgi:hypothetical protein